MLHVCTAAVSTLDLNFPQVIIESDSMEAIYLIYSILGSQHLYVEVVACIRCGMNIDGGITISFAPRELNCVADWLALCFPSGFHVFSASFGDCHRLIRLDL